MVASPGLPRVEATDARISASVEMAYQRIMFTSRYINEWVDHVEDYALDNVDIESEEGQNQAHEKWMDRFLDIYDILNRSVTKIAAEFESDAVAMAVVYRAGVLENAFVGEALRHVVDDKVKLREALSKVSMEMGDETYLADGWDMNPRISQMILDREGMLGAPLGKDNTESGEHLPDDIARLVAKNGTADLISTSVRHEAVKKGLIADAREIAVVFVRYAKGGTLLVHPDANEELLETMFVSADPDVDLEDSQEDALHVHAATFVYDEVYIVSSFAPQGDNIQAHLIGETLPPVPLRDLEDATVIGMVPAFFERNVTSAYTEGYYKHKELLPFLKREIAYGVIDDDVSETLVSTRTGEKVSFGEFCRGKDEIFVKTPAKSVSRVVGLPQDRSSETACTSALLADSFWYMVPSVVVQDVITMTWEERFFVVDNEIITSAGRVISDVPEFDADGEGCELGHGIERFSTGPETDSEVSDRAPFHDAKRRLVERVVETVAENAGGKEGNYVVDACMIVNEDGSKETAVVEFNGLSNAGLYGCNVYALVSAMSKSPVTPKVADLINGPVSFSPHDFNG